MAAAAASGNPSRIEPPLSRTDAGSPPHSASVGSTARRPPTASSLARPGKAPVTTGYPSDGLSPFSPTRWLTARPAALGFRRCSSAATATGKAGAAYADAGMDAVQRRLMLDDGDLGRGHVHINCNLEASLQVLQYLFEPSTMGFVVTNHHFLPLLEESGSAYTFEALFLAVDSILMECERWISATCSQASFCASASAGGHGHKHRHLVVPTSSLKPKSTCSGLRVTPPSSRGAWLPLYHRRGPCSPLRAAGRKLSTADILRRDQLRADGIRRKVISRHGNYSSDVTVPTTLGTSLKTLGYVVTVGLGTPSVAQTVIFDTGGDLSWVQCRPCPAPACHPQKDAVFDPAKSTTYSPFTCGSAACARLRVRAKRCSGRCQYVVKYADGSNTTGTYSSDELTLTSSDVVAGFRFGCSHAEQGGGTGLADGLIGLGGGANSLVSQMGEKAFSYCLPPTASDAGFLTLGGPRVASSRYVVTPMYRIKGAPTFHVVLLRAIVVAGRRLAVRPAVFAGGLVVDSGTVVTRLPPTAYRALRAAFRAEMGMYPRARPKSILDTCFNFTGSGEVVRMPRVSLVFDRGAAVELDPSGIMVKSCLAFAPVGDDDRFTGILGNVQQRTLEVLYDVGGGAVGFRRGAC